MITADHDRRGDHRLRSVGLKRLLAYSTVSVIAIMLSSPLSRRRLIGAGPAVLYLLSYLLFKPPLFLAIGWLSALVAWTAAVAMSPAVRHYPEPRWPIGVGLLALAGVPPPRRACLPGVLSSLRPTTT